jgi:long-chain fatty acid transport protein
MNFKPSIVVSLLIAAGLASPLAHATNGMLPIGYGLKSEGMGGAGIALPQDALAAATNPAGMVMVGDRIDMGLEWFKPNRTDTNGSTGATAVAGGTYDGNGRPNFFIPQFGYNKMISGNTSLGVSVFGNGGMNTAYNSNPFNGSSGVAGVNLAQLFISPTWSMKLNPQNSIGVSLNIAYQMFSATGIQGFSGISANSSAGFNNPGTDTATGYGLRLGWIGQVSPAVTLGATYQTKTKMSKFSKYAGLFSDQGELDVPANYGIGVAVKANSATTVAFDVERIEYSGVNAIGNPMPFGAAALGASNGPGFGWKSINAYKLGVSYAMDSKLTLRAGVDHCDQPIQSSQVMFNILAPGVIQNHLSLGATWTLADKSEVTVGYVHSFKNSVTGTPPAGYGTNPITLSMDQDAIGISYGW